MIRLFCPGRPGVVTLLVALAMLVTGVARAEDSKKAQCASAYEKSQELRAAGSLKAAHDMLVVCAQDFCPGFVQSDCAQWLTEVQRDLPTIVVVAKDKAGEHTPGGGRVLGGDEVRRQP